MVKEDDKRMVVLWDIGFVLVRAFCCFLAIVLYRQ